MKSGRIHLVLEWVPTSSESDNVDQVSFTQISHQLKDLCCLATSLSSYSSLCLQVLQFYSRKFFQNKAVPSAGLLFVFIEQADGLPVSLLLFM